jgi:hypothetical protein
MYGMYEDKDPNIDETLSSAENDGLRFCFAAYSSDSIPAIAENAASIGICNDRDPPRCIGYATCWVEVYPDDLLGLLVLVVTVAPQ